MARLHVSSLRCKLIAVKFEAGESITSGGVLELRKSKGDRVAADEVVAVIDSDKVRACRGFRHMSGDNSLHSSAGLPSTISCVPFAGNSRGAGAGSWHHC